jgi:DNA-binding transcriptional ArsR family regulator
MSAQPEPRFARIASLIADPSRSRMLALLLSGEARSAGELARAVAITPQTASSHLSQLRDAGLVKLRAQGRHRYFMLADADVARMLEALALVAERDDVSQRWDEPTRKPLRYARTCYCHLAGELGVKQHRALLERRVLIEREDGTLTLSDTSRTWLDTAHFDEANIAALYHDSNKKRFAYGCMDWSMRRDHLAGSFASALLEHYLAKNWLRKTATHRALAPTPAGAAMFAKLF